MCFIVSKGPYDLLCCVSDWRCSLWNALFPWNLKTSSFKKSTCNKESFYDGNRVWYLRHFTACYSTVLLLFTHCEIFIYSLNQEITKHFQFFCSCLYMLLTVWNQRSHIDISRINTARKHSFPTFPKRKEGKKHWCIKLKKVKYAYIAGMTACSRHILATQPKAGRRVHGNTIIGEKTCFKWKME